jgi:hypothetical protein
MIHVKKADNTKNLSVFLKIIGTVSITAAIKPIDNAMKKLFIFIHSFFETCNCVHVFYASPMIEKFVQTLRSNLSICVKAMPVSAILPASSTRQRVVNGKTSTAATEVNASPPHPELKN